MVNKFTIRLMVHVGPRHNYFTLQVRYGGHFNIFNIGDGSRSLDHGL